MSQKRADKIVSAILNRVAETIEQRYRIQRSEIMNLIEGIPESLRCKYTLVKGKRKGKICDIVLCPHHVVENPKPDPPELKTESSIFIPEANLDLKFIADVNEKKDEKYITTKEDTDLAAAIAESIMYSNLNVTRREKGLVSLGVINKENEEMKK